MGDQHQMMCTRFFFLLPQQELGYKTTYSESAILYLVSIKICTSW